MKTEWWQRGPVDGVPAVLQPVAYMVLQIEQRVGETTHGLTEAQWNARPAGVASAAFHVRHIIGVLDRLFTYARDDALSAEQFAALRDEGVPLVVRVHAPRLRRAERGHAARNVTVRNSGTASPCSRRSASTRNASAWTFATASVSVTPYSRTPGNAATAAIHRPSTSCSSSIENVMVPPA